MSVFAVLCALCYLVCDVFLCLVIFPYGDLGQVWNLIVLIHDLCLLPYLTLSDVFIFLSIISGAEPFVQFGRGHYKELFCEFISNLGQWIRSRCRLKEFLSGALAALLFSGAEPFVQKFGRGHHEEHSCEFI